MKELDNLHSFLNHRIDIIMANTNRWLSNKECLPTFDFYKKNVINDHKGKYDFINRKYLSMILRHPVVDEVNFHKVDLKGREIAYLVTHSDWMGTTFNVTKEIVTAKDRGSIRDNAYKRFKDKYK
jgi:hypothetical protein